MKDWRCQINNLSAIPPWLSHYVRSRCEELSPFKTSLHCQPWTPGTVATVASVVQVMRLGFAEPKPSEYLSKFHYTRSQKQGVWAYLLRIQGPQQTGEWPSSPLKVSTQVPEYDAIYRCFFSCPSVQSQSLFPRKSSQPNSPTELTRCRRLVSLGMPTNTYSKLHKCRDRSKEFQVAPKGIKKLISPAKEP